MGTLVNGIFGEFLSIKIPALRQLFTLAHCLSGNPLQCAAATAGNAYAGGASLKRALKSGLFAYVSAQAFRQTSISRKLSRWVSWTKARHRNWSRQVNDLT